MKKIIEKIRKITEEIKFILSDNTTAYGLTKEERIKIMEEYRALRDLRDKEIKELVDKYKTTEEYISAGFFKKLWLNAFLYEAEQIEKNERANGEKT